MWKSLKWGCLVIFVVFVGVMLVSDTTEAAGSGNWAGNDARIVSQAPITGIPSNANTCYGLIMRVTIRSTGDVEACLLGELGKTHLARYQGANGQYAYAIAMGDDTSYTRIDMFCSGLAWCAYSSSADSLLMSVSAVGRGYGQVFIKDFAKQLTYHALPEPHYLFSYDQTGAPISRDGSIIPTGALALSRNGNWALVELQEYGFVRVDMKTGEYRRVIAPGYQYGMGGDPAFELAISNDGRFAAVAGWRSGVTVYQMDNGCGDILSGASGRHFPQGAIACAQSAIQYQTLFPGFVFAEMPRFSEDGTRLSLLALTPTSVIHASITPLESALVSSTPLYVALGDSFVSGEGEIDDARYVPGTNTATNKCHVSNRSYPYLLHPIQVMNAANRACSGSRVEEVLKQSESLIISQPPDSISVGVGGNDINVMGKLKTCIALSTCEWALAENRLQTAKEIQRLYPRIVHALKGIQQHYPGARLFFVGYPKVINDTEANHCQFPISSLLDKEERRYMNETVGYLNQVLSAAARSAGVPFIDVGDVFEGERLCDASETAMNGIRVGDDFAPIASLGAIKVIGAESFHPTPRGHELVAARIRDELPFIQSSEQCGVCGAVGMPVLSPYWYEDENDSIAPSLIAARFLKSTEFGVGTEVAFTFPAQSFQALSSVTIELHSSPTLLGTFTADEFGALVGKLTINGTIGYHAVHAIGTSASGESIDRYEVVLIVDPAEDQAVIPSLLSPHQRDDAHQSPLLEQSDPLVKGVTITGSAPPTDPTIVIRELHPNWFLVLSIGGIVCLVSAGVAFSIGRRQV